MTFCVPVVWLHVDDDEPAPFLECRLHHRLELQRRVTGDSERAQAEAEDRGLYASTPQSALRRQRAGSTTLGTKRGAQANRSRPLGNRFQEFTTRPLIGHCLPQASSSSGATDSSGAPSHHAAVYHGGATVLPPFGLTINIRHALFDTNLL